jgi:hypothetical protein
MAQLNPIPFTDITFDVVNDNASKLMSTGRKLVELEAAVIEAKALVAKALQQQQGYIAGVLQQLS